MANVNDINNSDLAEQKTDSWDSKGKTLIVNDVFPFFNPYMLAVKELLQNGAVAGGKDAECLVKIYRDEEGIPHLLVANTADTPANLHAMMDFSNSQHENISHCNGKGTKAALSLMYPYGEGAFKAATRDNDGCIYYKESPYGTNMPIKKDDVWPVDSKYRTYVDTKIADFDKVKDVFEMGNLKDCLGALFGFRIDDGMKLNLEVFDETLGPIEANLPESVPETEEFWDRKAQLLHEKENQDLGEPDLTVNHVQNPDREIKRVDKDGNPYITKVSMHIENRVSDKASGLWRKMQKNQGAWLVMDGVIQAYIGTEIFGLSKHNSMNGMYTFIEYTDIQNGTFDGVPPMFDASKTVVNKSSDVGADLYKFFDEADIEKEGSDKLKNSISEWYRWKLESDTEAKIRMHQDHICEMYAIEETAAGTPTKYVKEYVQGSGNRPDGAILKFSQQNENTRVDAIFEYKKSPATSRDIDQVLRYIKEEVDNGNIPNKVVLCVPTLTQEALNYLVREIARVQNSGQYDLAKAYNRLSFYLFNEEYDNATCQQYKGKQLESLIDEDTFNTIKQSGNYWQSLETAPDLTPTELKYNKDHGIYGSAPDAILFSERIVEERQRQKENTLNSLSPEERKVLEAQNQLQQIDTEIAETTKLLSDNKSDFSEALKKIQDLNKQKALIEKSIADNGKDISDNSMIR